MKASRVIRIVIFLLILLAIPAVTIYLGEMTRTQIKADVACKSPAIPDPADCQGGTWKLNKDVNGCIHFVCTIK